MSDLETVMSRLDAHAAHLKLRSAAIDDEERKLMAESLALMSEAVLKVGRDIRFIRRQMAEGRLSLD
ncbi:hypothetical protein IHQ68_02645 [Chelatococcus sambhunathii]|uniref:Uncharacterized protein n=1 Tax=Chelatococcus sambhunathii TaxID=363953 RepID=A0ABU1DBN4_9HYPH|nr:hypothetical protein [Chelatococcus sambhunathii]MDR4305521.1 hypothetical protein [Chelatococcus sambhunathii]